MKRPARQAWFVPSIDALRVLLCAYIILFHAHLQAYGSYAIPALSQGISAVNVFFALSGFVLMASFLREGQELRGGISGYLLRRARRLLPLYYGCVALSVLSVIAAGIPRGTEGLTPTSLLAHVFLIQNYFPDDVSYAINSTYWFVAVEAQLYLVFPFIALAWKRFGPAPASLGVVSVSGVLWILSRGGTLFARPQILLIFLSGILAAYAVDRFSSGAKRARKASGYAAATFAAASCLFALAYANRGATTGLPIIELLRDLSSGAAGSALMAGLSLPGTWTRVRTATESRVFTVLAPFTYAAYMCHDLALRCVHKFAVAPLGFDGTASFLASLAIVVPVIAAVSWALYRVFERPFLTVRRSA